MTATVVGKSPEHLVLDGHDRSTGAPAGVRVNDPVINGEGLVGKVAQVGVRRRPGGPHHRQLDGRLRARSGRAARPASCSPRSANPTTCCCSTCPQTRTPTRANTSSPRARVGGADDSLYPPGILIGQVTSVNEESAYKSVNVHPVANLHDLDIVQVLTAPASAARPANLASLVASLPPGQSSRPRRRANSWPPRGWADERRASPRPCWRAWRRSRWSSCSSRSASSPRCRSSA